MGSQGTRKYDLRHECAEPRHETRKPSAGEIPRTAFSVFSAIFVVLLLFTLVILSPIGSLSEAQAGTTAWPFKPRILVNDNSTNDQVLPTVVAMEDGDFLVVWQDARSGNEDVYTSISRDNGSTFSRSVRADDVTGPSKQIEPAVAISGNGTIMVVWQDNRRSSFDYDIYIAKSYDDGTTFTKSVKVDDSNRTISWQEHPSIAIASDGTIYVAWTDDRTGILRVRGAFSTDGGATFSPSKELAPSTSPSGQNGCVLVSNGNRIFAALIDDVTGLPHPYISVSVNGGRSFSAPTRMDSTGTPGHSQRSVAIAAMPDGGIAAVWEDSRNGGWDIYASLATKTGAATGSDFRVDDDVSMSYQRNAVIAADQVGNLYVVWEDERDLLFAIRFAYAEVGSTQFSASVQVAAPGRDDVQRRASIVTIDPGQVFVTWQDDRFGTYDVFFSAGYIPDLFNLPLVRGWNLVSVYLAGFTYKASTLGLRPGDVVVGWNSSSEAYDQSYIVGLSPPSSDFYIKENAGYWIYAGTAETLNLLGSVPKTTQSRFIEVPTGGGWAMIGLESTKRNMHASDIPAMYSVPGGMPLVAVYDPVTGVYENYYTGVPSTDFPLVTGKAYWCWCSSSGMLTYEP